MMKPKFAQIQFLPPYITQSLELFTVKCYRGGAREIALIRRVRGEASVSGEWRFPAGLVEPHPQEVEES